MSVMECRISQMKNKRIRLSSGFDFIITLLTAITVLVFMPCVVAAEVIKSENPVNLEADSMDYDKSRDVYHAKGNAKIIYGDATLSADDMELDSKNDLATAQGSTVLKMGEDHLQGDKIVFNVADKTGTVYNASAFYARNHFYIKGDEIQKTGESTYFVKKPLATTCDDDEPAWAIAGSEMKVTIEGYGLMKNARFLAGGLPVFYSPYLPFPAKTKRQSGFLFPYLAYSRDKDGLDIEVPFFWAISPQTDATFYQRFIEKRGFKEGVEFRYDLGDKFFGTVYGDYLEDLRHVHDSNDEDTRRGRQDMYVHKRWSYYLNHQTNFDPQFYIRTDFIKVSDQWYFKDFSAHNYYLDQYARTAEDNFKNVSFKADKSLRYLESAARLYKGWSNYNITSVVHYTDDFAVADNELTLQKYPEIILSGIKQPLWGMPFYYALTGTYDYLYRGEGDQGHFVDFSPSVSLPLDIFHYAKLTPQFIFKETYWNLNADQDDARGRADEKDKTGDRTIYNASVALSSQLSRVFDVNGRSWEKIRHEIKPEIIYAYVPEVSADHVPDYYLPVASPFVMPITSLSSNTLTGQNAVAWSLTNTLTARLKDAAGRSSYLEFFRLKLFQAYDIHESRRDVGRHDPERKPFSDLGIEFDFTLHKYMSLRSRNIYNGDDGWKQNNFDLQIRDWRGDSLLVGYRDTEDFIEEIHLGVKAVITENLDSTFVFRHDLLNSRKIEHALGLFYHKQCWGLGLEYAETDDDVRFLLKVSLAGFGKPDAK